MIKTIRVQHNISTRKLVNEGSMGYRALGRKRAQPLMLLLFSRYLAFGYYEVENTLLVLNSISASRKRNDNFQVLAILKNCSNHRLK